MTNMFIARHACLRAEGKYFPLQYDDCNTLNQNAWTPTHGKTWKR